MDQFASVSKIRSTDKNLCIELNGFFSASDYDNSIRPGPSSGLKIDCIPVVLELLQVFKHF